MRNYSEDQDSPTPSRVIHLGKSNRTPLASVPIDNTVPIYSSTLKSSSPQIPQQYPTTIPISHSMPTPSVLTPTAQLLLTPIL